MPEQSAVLFSAPNTLAQSSDLKTQRTVYRTTSTTGAPQVLIMNSQVKSGAPSQDEESKESASPVKNMAAA